MNRLAIIPFLIFSLANLVWSEQNQDSANAFAEARRHEAPRLVQQHLLNSAYVNFYFYGPMRGHSHDYRQYVEFGYTHDFSLLRWLSIQTGAESRSLSLLGTLGAVFDFRFFQLGITGIGGYLAFLKANQVFHDFLSDTVPLPISNRSVFDLIIKMRIGTSQWNFALALTPSVFTLDIRNKLHLLDCSLNLNIVSIGAYVDEISVVYGSVAKDNYWFSNDMSGGLYLGINNLLHVRNIKITPRLFCYPDKSFGNVSFTTLFEW
jgi:hypothetical protein